MLQKFNAQLDHVYTLLEEFTALFNLQKFLHAVAPLK